MPMTSPVPGAVTGAGMLPALEHSSEAFARHSCEAYAALDGHHLTRQPKDAVTLVRDAPAAAIGVARTRLPTRARDAP